MANSNSDIGTRTVTAYAFSRDRQRKSVCTGECAAKWVPVYTTGRPLVAGGLSAKDVGVIRRSDGTYQVTYEDKPLYMYSGEKGIFLTPGGAPQSAGSAGNGNGLVGARGGRFSVVAPA